MGLRDKLKKSIQSSKVQVSNKTMDKLKSSVMNKTTFKTPKSNFEIENFEKNLTKNIIDSPSSIGRGAGSVKNFLNDQLDSSIENLVDKAKDKVLNSASNGILQKVKKSSKGNILNSIIGGGSSNQNLANNPAFKSWDNSYRQKSESLNEFVSDGMPYIEFKVHDEYVKNSRDFQNNKLFSPEPNATKDSAEKKVKIPISPDFMKTGYTFTYDEESRLRDKTDISTAAALKAGEKFDGLSKLTKVAGQYSGVTVNPNMENAFKGVDFRKLSFNFELIPRNEKQSKQLDLIIHMFKYWAHPIAGTAAGVKTLLYPAQWVISYHDGGGGTNGVSFKTKPCYCTSINIEYGSTNGYLLFRTNDRPTSVRFNLSFTENEYITRNDLASHVDGGEY